MVWSYNDKELNTTEYGIQKKGGRKKKTKLKIFAFHVNDMDEEQTEDVNDKVRKNNKIIVNEVTMVEYKKTNKKTRERREECLYHKI